MVCVAKSHQSGTLDMSFFYQLRYETCYELVPKRFIATSSFSQGQNI